MIHLRRRASSVLPGNKSGEQPEMPPSTRHGLRPGIFPTATSCASAAGFAVAMSVGAVLIFCTTAWCAYQFCVFMIDKWPW